MDDEEPNYDDLIADDMANAEEPPSEDDLYAAETYYSISSRFKYDLKLFIKYFAQAFKIIPRPKTDLTLQDS